MRLNRDIFCFFRSCCGTIEGLVREKNGVCEIGAVWICNTCGKRIEDIRRHESIDCFEKLDNEKE